MIMHTNHFISFAKYTRNKNVVAITDDENGTEAGFAIAVRR